MEIGFPPKYVKEFYIAPATPEQYFVWTREAFTELGWELCYMSKEQMTARIKGSFGSEKSEITIRNIHGFIEVKSESLSSQILSWGRNKKNVEEFLACVASLQESMSPEDIEEKWLRLQDCLVLEEQDLNGNEQAFNQASSFFSLLIPGKGNYISPILVYLNVFVFVLMVISGVSMF